MRRVHFKPTDALASRKCSSALRRMDYAIRDLRKVPVASKTLSSSHPLTVEFEVAAGENGYMKARNA